MFFCIFSRVVLSAFFQGLLIWYFGNSSFLVTYVAFVLLHNELLMLFQFEVITHFPTEQNTLQQKRTAKLCIHITLFSADALFWYGPSGYQISYLNAYVWANCFSSSYHEAGMVLSNAAASTYGLWSPRYSREAFWMWCMQCSSEWVWHVYCVQHYGMISSGWNSSTGEARCTYWWSVNDALGRKQWVMSCIVKTIKK